MTSWSIYTLLSFWVIHTAWTVNDILVDIHPFITLKIKGCISTKTSLTVHTVHSINLQKFNHYRQDNHKFLIVSFKMDMGNLMKLFIIVTIINIKL